MMNKLMLVDDQILWRYFELLSRRPPAEVAELQREVARGAADVVAVKELFAREIVARYHGADAADAALARRRTVAAGGVPEDVAEIAVESAAEQIGLAKALQLAGMTRSFSEGARLIQQGGVQLEGERVTDPKRTLAKGGRFLVRVGGKDRRFAYLVVR
jgi:tyrosyl-tRNA synthetase